MMYNLKHLKKHTDNDIYLINWIYLLFITGQMSEEILIFGGSWMQQSSCHVSFRGKDFFLKNFIVKVWFSTRLLIQDYYCKILYKIHQ